MKSSALKRGYVECRIAGCLWMMSAGWLFAESAPLNVLFIGNSQTSCCDLPSMVKIISESAPGDYPRIEVARALKGGMGLKGYWEAGEGKGTPRAMIASRKWDFVVIQEIYRARESDFEKYAELFDDLIGKNGAKTVVFATAGVSKWYHPAFSYPDSFKRLNDMQVAFGARKAALVAAAGYAWMRYLGPTPSDERLLALYHKDKGHPGPKGTYIYACLLYSCLTGKNPEGLAREFKNINGGVSISKEEAALMQKAAWETYRKYNVPVKNTRMGLGENSADSDVAEAGAPRCRPQ